MTYWHGLIISRTKRLNFWQKFLHFIFCQKYFLESIRIILDGDRLSVHSEKSPCFNSRCIMDWNVSSLSHVWTFLNMMNREYLVENFQVLYNWLFRNFQFSNFNFFSSVWIMIEMTLSNSILDGPGTMFSMKQVYKHLHLRLRERIWPVKILSNRRSLKVRILEKNPFSEHI